MSNKAKVLLWVWAGVLFVVVIMCIASSASVAGAAPLCQEETSTPTASATPTLTPTFALVYVTPTPENTKQFDCADSYPTGWMTITPNINWSSQCSKCLSILTPYSSWTPWPTWTGTVGPTPTGPTPTRTATVTAVPTSGWDVHVFNWHYGVSAQTGIAYSDAVTCTDENGVQVLSGVGLISGSSHWVTCHGRTKATVTSGSNRYMETNFYAADPINGHTMVIYYQITTNPVNGDALDTSCTGSGSMTIAYSNPHFQCYGADHGINTWEAITWDVTMSVLPLTGNPIATSTPNWAGSYCSVVDGWEAGNAPEWEDYIPIPRSGYSMCADINMLPVEAIIDAAMSVIGYPDSTDGWPEDYRICVDLTLFGQLQLFGVVVDVDVLIATLAFITLLYLFLRS